MKTIYPGIDIGLFSRGIPVRWKSILSGLEASKSTQPMKSSLLGISVSKGMKINSNHCRSKGIRSTSTLVSMKKSLKKKSVFTSKRSSTRDILEDRDNGDEVETRRKILRRADNIHHDDIFQSQQMKKQRLDMDKDLKTKIRQIDTSLFDLFDSNEVEDDEKKCLHQKGHENPSWGEAHSYLKRVR